MSCEYHFASSLPLVSREWKNGSNSSYNCTPFLHSLLSKGKAVGWIHMFLLVKSSSRFSVLCSSRHESHQFVLGTSSCGRRSGSGVGLKVDDFLEISFGFRGCGVSNSLAPEKLATPTYAIRTSSGGSGGEFRCGGAGLPTSVLASTLAPSPYMDLIPEPKENVSLNLPALLPRLKQ